MKRNRIIFLCAVSVVLFAVLFSFVKIPFEINGVAKILPAQQWLLYRGSNGEIFTNTVNNISGIVYSSLTYSFERGESAVLDIKPFLQNGQLVAKGDTLGVIFSSSRQEELIQLQGELRIATATLRANESGDKKTVVREARERLAQAQGEFEKQNKVVQRLKTLDEKDLVARAEYQTALDELNVLAKTIDVRKAELETTLSGVKDDEINLLKEKIAAVKNEITFLKGQISAQNTIIAPFDGRIERSFSTDTLLVLSNIDSGIAVIPVELKKSSHIQTGTRVSFAANGLMGPLTGTIHLKQPVMKIVAGKQCIMVLAAIQNLPNSFISGIITQAKINCGQVSLQTMVKRNML